MLDTDFVVMHPCTGRQRGLRGCLLDVVCKLTGHNLWRSGSIVASPEGSLDCFASYCRRCFKGGYVKGDYAPKRTR